MRSSSDKRRHVFKTTKSSSIPTVKSPRQPFKWKLTLALGFGCFAVGAWVAVKSLSRAGDQLASSPNVASLPASIVPADTPTDKKLLARQDEAFNALVNRGTALLSEGKPHQAFEVLSNALQMKPADEDVHYDLGLVLTRLEKFQEAAHQYEEALRIYPKYVEAHNNLGNLLLRLGRSDEAIQHLETAVKIMPDYASAHNNLGTALQRAGRADEAIIHFEKAADLQPDYWQAHFNVGTSCLEAGRLSEAQNALKIVMRLNPDFQPAKEALAEVEARQLTANPKPEGHEKSETRRPKAERSPKS
jgi:tetratricopeptide (TPR) repeat protein